MRLTTLISNPIVFFLLWLSGIILQHQVDLNQFVQKPDIATINHRNHTKSTKTNLSKRGTEKNLFSHRFFPINFQLHIKYYTHKYTFYMRSSDCCAGIVSKFLLFPKFFWHIIHRVVVFPMYTCVLFSLRPSIYYVILIFIILLWILWGLCV